MRKHTRFFDLMSEILNFSAIMFPGGFMSKIFVALFWLTITAILIKYTLLWCFKHDAGIAGPAIASVTILWLYAFFKNPTKGK
jgi:hypothetical protein